MIKNNFFTVNFCLALSLVIVFPASFSTLTSVKKEFQSDRDVVSDALKEMRQQIKKSTGTAHLISCTYRLDKDMKTINREMTIHYSDYRKKSDQVKQVFAHGDVARVLEVIYNVNDKKHVGVIKRHHKHERKRLEERDIKIPSTVFA